MSFSVGVSPLLLSDCLEVDESGRCERGRDGEWWSKGDRLKGGGGVLPVEPWPASPSSLPPSIHPFFFLPLSLSGFDRSHHLPPPPPPLSFFTPVLRHASLSKVALQSDVFLLLPWLYFMPSCLFSPFFSFHPPCFLLSLPAIFTHTHNKKKEEANTEIETSVVRQIIACILDFFIYVCTLFTPKPACFMHCVGGGMHFFFF